MYYSPVTPLLGTRVRQLALRAGRAGGRELPRQQKLPNGERKVTIQSSFIVTLSPISVLHTLLLWSGSSIYFAQSENVRWLLSLRYSRAAAVKTIRITNKEDAFVLLCHRSR